MRYQPIPRWTFVMLVVMGLAIVAGAFAFIVFVPAPVGLIVGTIWLTIGGAMALLALRGLRRSAADDRVRRDGIAATATVLRTAPTHVTIDNVPQWAIGVRIDGMTAPYEATLKLLTSTPPALGTAFGVRVDPLEHGHVVVAAIAGDDGDRAAAPAGADAADDADDADDAMHAAHAPDRDGLAPGETARVNADGSRTITVQAAGGAALDAATTAEKARLLASLEHLRASGSYSQAQYEIVKASLLRGD